MRVIAMLSGTSVDAIDVAAADLTWSDHGDAGAREVLLHPLGHREVPWPDGLRERLLAVLAPAASGAMEICDLHAAAGRALGDVARSAVAELAGGRADLVVSHGQTVAHQVAGDRCLGTLQLGGPSWIAEATGLPVLSDLRSRDIAAGGHGAPLASTFDALWLSGAGVGDDPGGCTAALNLGGIANVTVVHPDPGGAVPTVSAWDTGPANCLLDLAAARVSGGRLTCDLDGELAATGRVDSTLLDELLREPYYALGQPKSTGRELFDGVHLDRALAAAGALRDPLSGPDLLATLVELTACTVTQALAPYGVNGVVVSGGGTRNPVLMQVLRQRLGVPVRTSDERGIASAAKEAYVFAVIGYLAYNQLPCVPRRAGGPPQASATGARARRPLGSFTPGDRPLVLGRPGPEPVRMRIVTGAGP